MIFRTAGLDVLLVRLLLAVTDFTVPGKIQDAGSLDWWDVSSPPVVNTPEPAHQVFPMASNIGSRLKIFWRMGGGTLREGIGFCFCDFDMQRMLRLTFALYEISNMFYLRRLRGIEGLYLAR